MRGQATGLLIAHFTVSGSDGLSGELYSATIKKIVYKQIFNIFLNECATAPARRDDRDVQRAAAARSGSPE
jgi:hypothetical protein